jgi:hypothetical protein
MALVLGRQQAVSTDEGQFERPNKSLAVRAASGGRMGGAF